MQHAVPPTPRTNILLIDDSLSDLRSLMDLLISSKLRVCVAFDGQKGYEQAMLLKPELILLDVNMPNMDGFSVCRLLKANPSTQPIPVIFLTASTELAERLEGFACGGVDYISKPFAAEEVLARIGVHRQLARQQAAATPSHTVPEKITYNRDEILVIASQKILLAHLAHPPTLEDLARRVGTNRRTLNDAFQQVCGMPVFTWLREERLSKGHRLLMETHTPISMISEYLGFSTPANFSKAFRDRYQCSPRTLRSHCQDSNGCTTVLPEA